MIGKVKPAKPVCPYCKGKLENVPKRKKKCPFCGERIYIRRRPGSKKRRLVTKDSADEVDKLWRERSDRMERAEFLRKHRLSKKDYENVAKGLSQKWGKEPDQRDVLWGLLNTLIISRSNLQEKATIYGEMAHFLDEEGKDFSAVLQEHHRMVLLDLKQSGYTKVKIKFSGKLPGIGCNACKAQNGDAYPIEQALAEMPLPCKDCDSILGGRKGFCRCFYQCDALLDSFEI